MGSFINVVEITDFPEDSNKPPSKGEAELNGQTSFKKVKVEAKSGEDDMTHRKVKCIHALVAKIETSMFSPSETLHLVRQ